eukprot:SM000001S04631  [mRNA]  locus=s1:1303987:1308811:- [translate_table: standard]
MAQTLSGQLAAAAEAHGGRVAIAVAQGGAQKTHAELHAAIEHCAAEVRRAGIRSGDLVSLVFPNSIEFVVAFLGVVRMGAVAAPLNAAYKEDEFRFFLEDAKSRLLLVPQPDGNGPAEAAAAALGLPVAGIASWLQEGLGVGLEPRARLEVASQEPQDGAGPLPSPEADALFLHTSGTTSRPKGVPLTQANLAASVANIIRTYDLSPEDRSYVVMPLFHVHGLMAALLASLAAGGSIALPAAGRFSAGAFWADVRALGVTWYTAVPTMHQILLSRHKSQPEAEYPSLRFIRSCSSSLAPAVLANLEDAFGAPVLEAYAMTEASHQMTANPLPAHGPHKPGTVGKPTGIELGILDDNGKVLGPDEEGEVCINGPNVTHGYRDNPEANKTAFAYGWFHTGDRGKLDAEGYLTLTGRIKELINRGGEKISPLEVDAALLAHPDVAEAVTFAAPDEKYGEEVNAALVLNKGTDASERTIQDYLHKQLAAFKIPKRIFFAQELPRTATGKIQRRMMVDVFVKKADNGASKEGPAKNQAGIARLDGNAMLARALARLGLHYMFGVVGIPVTSLATACQVAGIRFIAFRNEQSASYAAGAAGYLTGRPGLLLTVSGPGAVHGLAGLSNAMINAWPMVMVSGSSVQADVGRGDFQELDQVAAVAPFVKAAGKVTNIKLIPQVAAEAVKAALQGRPGGAYIDIPADVLHESLLEAEAEELLAPLEPVLAPWEAKDPPPGLQADSRMLSKAVDLLCSAKKPLVVFGKGAAYARAEKAVALFVDSTGLPFLATPMGKGLLPDSHPASAAAARSLALSEADVVLVVGARLNWMLHFGEPPRWSADAKFILIDIDGKELELRKPAVPLLGDARVVMEQLTQLVKDKVHCQDWLQAIQRKARGNVEKMSAMLAKDTSPLNFHCSLRIIRDAMSALGHPAPILVSEGANTMDIGRAILEQKEPRTRLDAGTWGTMGVGLGYAIAAAVVEPERLVVAVEGDSAFGFSGMEVETMVRYKLPIVIIVMNNGGVYGGERRAPVSLPEAIALDPAPTAFVPDAKYDLLMEAFGGKGYYITTSQELEVAVAEAFGTKKPALINVIIDPMAGSESATMGHRN